jgi:hypothetical protein
MFEWLWSTRAAEEAVLEVTGLLTTALIPPASFLRRVGAPAEVVGSAGS